MIVLKFGGTSVGTSESLKNVKNIVESLTEDAVVVVSALGGLTDRLIATAKGAADSSCDFIAEWEGMAERHYRIIADMIEDQEKITRTREAITPLLEELKNLYQGINLISYLPAPTLDRIVSLGERMSSIIVANIIKGASHADSLNIIKTEKWHDKNIASTELTDRLIRENLAGKQYPVVMGGFISTDKDSGEITNLGRGGSDYTAALVAAALDADVLQIWTDVDGFLTTDPRIVKNARVIEEMSFVESMDLCTFGAKVIYPPTIYPVFHKNIPIRILNTHRPQAPGTLICDHPKGERKGIVGLSALKDLSLITMRGSLIESDSTISSRVHNAISKKGIKGGIQTPAAPDTFAFSVPSSEAIAAHALLMEEFAPEMNSEVLKPIEIRSGLAAIAAVGDNIREIPALSGLILNLIKSSGVEVPAYSDRMSETTLSYLIPEDRVSEILNLLHSTLLPQE